jgi:hypothetical protein
MKAKQKGSRWEYACRDSLKHLDPSIRRSLGSGAFGHIIGSDESDIVTSLPLAIECKNQETVSLYPWWEQAKEQCKSMDRIPVLAVKKNNCDGLAVMHWNDFVHLLEFALTGGYKPLGQLAKSKVRKVKQSVEETKDLKFSKYKQVHKGE